MIVNCCNPQPKRINKPQRIAFHIPIGIQPPSQPNRVALDIAPCPRVIVPEVVVVQPRIGIKHLPGKAQGDVGGNAVLVGVLLGLGGAKRLVGWQFPDHGLAGVGGQAGVCR